MWGNSLGGWVLHYPEPNCLNSCATEYKQWCSMQAEDSGTYLFKRNCASEPVVVRRDFNLSHDVWENLRSDWNKEKQCLKSRTWVSLTQQARAVPCTQSICRRLLTAADRTASDSHWVYLSLLFITNHITVLPRGSHPTVLPQLGNDGALVTACSWLQ